MSTRTLVIMRHARAAFTSAGGDRARPLDPDGERQAREAGELLSGLLGRIDVAVSSDAVRAARTLDLVISRVEAARLWRDASLYTGGEEAVLEVARTLEGRVGLIVCHEPTVTGAVARLRGSGQQPRWGTPTAGMALLRFEGEWETLTWGTCDLTLL